MTIGTRVQHKRYPWMVGRILSIGAVNDPSGRNFMVRWFEGTGFHDAMKEYESDLRATPVQP